MSLVQKLNIGNLDILGDIHGEIEALKKIIKSLGYDINGSHPEGRKLVFVGDLVDRGPDSPAVIKFVKNLIDHGNAQAILGNHELNLLQKKAKDGAGWYFAERFAKDIKYQPFNVAQDKEVQEIYNFLANLPLALERDDLRIVHATWDNEKINTVRRVPLGTIAQYYSDFECSIDKNIESSGLLKAYSDEQIKWDKEQSDSETQNMPFLDNTCEYNLAHQMGNPVRVLTSGVEKKTETPFYASGKWRFVERFAWWNEYSDDIPVVVGHFWRRFSGASHDPENLFSGVAPESWHGVKNNVFCVDFSVGGRFLERHKNLPLGQDTQLVALRWPENILMLEDGTTLETTHFKEQKKKPRI